MPGKPPGVRQPVIFQPTPLFASSFATFQVRNPSIIGAMASFQQCKSTRPPTPLPRGMRDHKLAGRLLGFSECHLAGDACLIYTDKGNVVKLIAVVNHDELEGGKEKALANRISPYR